MTAFFPPNHADEPGDFDVWLENQLRHCSFDDGVAVLKMPENLYVPLPSRYTSPRRLSATLIADDFGQHSEEAAISGAATRQPT